MWPTRCSGTGIPSTLVSSPRPGMYAVRVPSQARALESSVLSCCWSSSGVASKNMIVTSFENMPQDNRLQRPWPRSLVINPPSRQVLSSSSNVRPEVNTDRPCLSNQFERFYTPVSLLWHILSCCRCPKLYQRTCLVLTTRTLSGSPCITMDTS